MTTPRRCPWASTPLSIEYHDREWGVPVYDDMTLFEFVVLEGAQAGLSWETILKKRTRYRELFCGFDPRKVARFDGARVARLLKDEGIVRNRLKVTSTVDNARAFLDVQREHGSFATYLWAFVDGVPVRSRWKEQTEVPAETDLSRALSKDLRRRGFRFVGPTICYAFLQAVGVVNDHLISCFRHKAVEKQRR